MKHRILHQVTDLHPFEIVKVRLIADNDLENKSISNLDQSIEDYLTLNLDAVDIIENTPPDFLIKRVKQNIGFGN